MNELKDIRHNVFSKFLDPVVHTNPFGNNRSGERAYRRAERIVAALFLLTNHIEHSELLRSEAREVAMSILPQILELRSEMRSSSSEKMVELQATIRHLISLIKMMVFGGLVSVPNAEVAIAALEDLNTFLSLSMRSTLSDTLRLSKDDFLDVRDDHKGQLKDIKDTRNIKDKSTIKDMPSSSILPSTAGSRIGGIVSILKTGGELGIRDIAAQLPEYGEKTIQRDLTLLIRQGVVQRTGRKRWSRYSLIARES